MALSVAPGVTLTLIQLGALVADLEAACGAAVDLVLMPEAPPALAYRSFAEGRLLVERDHRLLVEHKVRAIMEYLDFAPNEALCASGVLRAAARG